MLPNLYFVQNMLTFSGTVLIQLPKPNDLFCINPYYVKNERSFEQLAHDIKTLFPYMNEVKFKDIANYEYHNILLTTLADDSYPVISSLKVHNLILIEDGAGDYISHVNKNPYYSYKVWLFQPSLVKHDEIHDKGMVSLDGALCLISQLYKDELNLLNHYDEDTPCLFTTPLAEDFEGGPELVDKIMSYLKDKMGIEKLVISTHPRDHFVYEHKGIETFTIPQNMPGQLINRLFRGKKIYLFPSTVVMSSRETDMITLLDPFGGNKKYDQSMRAVLDSSIFTNRPHEIIQIDSAI